MSDAHKLEDIGDGRVVCELCDAALDDTGPETDELAFKLGWVITWDGWICPKDAKELIEDGRLVKQIPDDEDSL